MQFSGVREGLGTTESRANGFFLHISLAVTGDRAPVGVLSAETWVRPLGYRRKGNKRDTRKDPSRESLRWWRAVEQCDQRWGSSSAASHVMDREGDNYDLFSKLIANECRYVIRLAHNRNLVGEVEKLKEVVSRTSAVFQREVCVSKRTARSLALKKAHPAWRVARCDLIGVRYVGRIPPLNKLRSRQPSNPKGQCHYGNRRELPVGRGAYHLVSRNR